MPYQSQVFTKKAIEEAEARIKPFIHNTPVLTSSSINKMVGGQLFFKCENFQKVGAFKMRGAANAISQLSFADKKNGVVTHSSGNHAQAVARAASLSNIPAFIVMPENAPKVKVDAVKEYGGKVTFCTPTNEARENTAKKIVETKGATFIHPFDNDDVIIGQATCAKELIEEIPELDSIICPVGGGGLLSGTILTAKFFGNNMPVFAAEPEGADDAYRSLKSNERQTNKETNTIADGLLTPLGERNFSIIRKGVEEIFLVNDDEIKAALRIIWERMKIVVEPSCATALAAILKNKKIAKGKKVGVILTGGNLDLNKLKSIF